MKNFKKNNVAFILIFFQLILVTACHLDDENTSLKPTDETGFSKPDLPVPEEGKKDPTSGENTALVGDGWAIAKDIPLSFGAETIFGESSEVHSYKATVINGVVGGSFEAFNYDKNGVMRKDAKGKVTCVVFQKDCKTVRMTGIITESTDPFYIGKYAIWTVVDNGDELDQTTDLRYGVPEATALYHCSNGYSLDYFSEGLFLTTEGDIKVECKACDD